MVLGFFNKKDRKGRACFVCFNKKKTPILPFTLLFLPKKKNQIFNLVPSLALLDYNALWCDKILNSWKTLDFDGILKLQIRFQAPDMQQYLLQ